MYRISEDRQFVHQSCLGLELKHFGKSVLLGIGRNDLQRTVINDKVMRCLGWECNLHTNLIENDSFIEVPKRRKQRLRCFVYADRPQKGMLALNARIVNRDIYEYEQQSIAEWHRENVEAERNL